MRFRKEFLRLEKEFTFQNYLVLMPYLDGMFHKKRYKNEQWESLMAQSYRRIELSDIIFVVNKRRYIGTHTKQEIEFAQHLKKEIRYLEE
jgi:hypothetical protein